MFTGTGTLPNKRGSGKRFVDYPLDGWAGGKTRRRAVKKAAGGGNHHAKEPGWGNFPIRFLLFSGATLNQVLFATKCGLPAPPEPGSSGAGQWGEGGGEIEGLGGGNCFLL